MNVPCISAHKGCPYSIHAQISVISTYSPARPDVGVSRIFYLHRTAGTCTLVPTIPAEYLTGAAFVEPEGDQLPLSVRGDQPAVIQRRTR